MDTDPRGGSGPILSDADALALGIGPRLELDQLLSQLIGRAEDVLAAQGRLRGLLAANQMIIGNLALPVVLRRITEAACTLVKARYGALGVLSPDGGLESFLTVGLSEEQIARIGHLPEGKGLLGALIDEPESIRLKRITDDGRSVGFPANHPPMTSFLGVPIRVRDEVFGNLYLTEREGGEFTAEDEELVTALAATAGVAIENARLYEESRSRQNWLMASTRVTQQLLSIDGEDPLRLIAALTRELADADIATVVLPTPEGERMMVEVSSGEGAADLSGTTYPIADSLAGMAFQGGAPVLMGNVRESSRFQVHLQPFPVGPVMALPLIGSDRPRGALVVGRKAGRPRFAEVDVNMATTFANHAAIALELAAAREDQQRMELLEDRDRIARDLHDHVIQRLFAAGLTIQSVAAGMAAEPERADRLGRVVDDIDATIRQIRSTIFQLRGPLTPGANGLRTQLLKVANETRPLLGYDPDLEFQGPLDVVVPDEVVDDVVAVVREALSNAARHAGATQVAAIITAEPGRLIVVVRDNGVGLTDQTRRSGLDNLRRRAERLGGTFDVASPVTDPAAFRADESDSMKDTDTEQIKGTELRWTIPLS